jgi:hypothetical protein
MRYGFLVAIHILVLVIAVFLLLLWMVPKKKKGVMLMISSTPTSTCIYEIVIVSLTLLRQKGYARTEVEEIRSDVLPDEESRILLLRIFPHCRAFRLQHNPRKNPEHRRIRINPSDAVHHALSFPVEEWSSLSFSSTLRFRQKTLNVVVLDCGERQSDVLSVLSNFSWIRVHQSPKVDIQGTMADADCILGSGKGLEYQMHMKPGGTIMEFTSHVQTSSRYHTMAIAMRHFYLMFYRGRLSHPLLQQYEGDSTSIDGEFKQQLTHVMKYLQSMYLQ